MSEPEPEHRSADRRPVRRSIPAMSAEEHLERLRADIDTVLQLQLHAFSEEAWEPVAEALAEYGYGVIKGWIYSGQIFIEVESKGYGAVERCPMEWFDNGAGEELANLTAAEAIRYFKDKVLVTGRWNARRGASLATYFVGQCKFQFANVYKTWRHDQARYRARVALYDDPRGVSGGPETTLIVKEAVELALERLSSPLAREVFRKKFILGHSYEQIAASTVGVKDAKSAMNLVFREKQRMERR